MTYIVEYNAVVRTAHHADAGSGGNCDFLQTSLKGSV